MILGVRDFRKGQRLRGRIGENAGAVMSLISGWKSRDGRLVAERVVSKLNTGAALPATIPDQTPFAFVRDGATILVARDADEKMRELSAGAWSAAGDAADVLAGSVPVRLADQIIIATGGPDAKLMAYEPGSPGTKLRPLSLKSPLHYDAAARPTVAPSAAAGLELFDCEDANPWAAPGTGCSVDNTGTDVAVLTVGATTPVSHKAFTKSLGATGVSLTGKVYLAVDALCVDDPQATVVTGQFANDTDLFASGYELALYSDTACTTLLKKMAIPRLVPLGKVSRIVFHLGGLTGTVKGIGILTAAYFKKPPKGETHSLKVYSEAFAADWQFKGNGLYPATKFAESPWTERLPPTSAEATSAAVLQRFTPTYDEMEPESPEMVYSYCFLGKDRLSVTLYNHMVSNPSEDSTPDTFADPWRDYLVEIALPGSPDVMTEYGDYITHVLLYRQMYDGETLEWEDPKFIKAVAIAASVSYTDQGADDDPLLNDVEVPEAQELTNDYASSAAHVAQADNRVWAGCLDWDNTNGRWRRPTAIMVGSLYKPWAYPTTIDEDSTVEDGTELDGYARTGSELRALLARNDLVVVFLDNEFFVAVGRDPIDGYRFVRQDGIGTESARSVADCRSRIIWGASDDFYQWRGGLAEPIGKDLVDATLVDWTKPHNAVYHDDHYVLHCYYDGQWSVLSYDIPNEAWRVRPSSAYDLVGICAADAGGSVYGLKQDGNAVTLFDGTADYGADGGVTTRTADTQFLLAAQPDSEVHASQGLIEAITQEVGGVILALTFRSQGQVDQSQAASLTLLPGKTRYEVDINLQGNAFKVETAYEGTTPPELYFLGLSIDEGRSG